MMKIKGFNKMLRKVQTRINNVANYEGTLRAGFFPGDTYADGTPVAAVAAWNVQGNPEQNRPPRDFMAEAKKPERMEKVSAIIRSGIQNDVAADQVLGRAGLQIESNIREAIYNGSYEPLAQSTIKAKKGRTKPLIDKAVMARGVRSEYRKAKS